MRTLLAMSLWIASSVSCLADDVPQMTIKPTSKPAILLRGIVSLTSGDISAARRLLEGAAHDGSPLAAHMMGQSYDPVWLAQHGVIGVEWLCDVGLSIQWYRLAYQLGDRSPGNRYAAAQRQTDLEHTPQH